MSLVERQIEVLAIPFAQGLKVLRPERAVLDFGSGRTLDLGAFCYARRSAPLGARRNRNRPLSERLVDLTSLVPERVPSMRDVLVYLSEKSAVEGLRPETIHGHAECLLRFLDWAEGNGHGYVLTRVERVRPAFAAYVEHLRHRVDTGQIHQNTGAILQNTAMAVLQDLTGCDDLHHGLNLLRGSKNATVTTEPASEEAQGRLLALCQGVFDGLADLSLEFRRYPYPLQVPAFVGANANRLWVFPVTKWCMLPHELAVREEQRQGFWAYDYLAGRLATVDEIAPRYVHNPRKQRRETRAEMTIRNAAQLLDNANRDPRNVYRREAAFFAHNMFIVLFLANKSMNWATLCELPWSGTYEVATERQGFRAIKYRAGGRIVSFEIQAKFLPTFKKFLRIREYLLDGATFEKLFFRRGQSLKGIKPLTQNTLANIFVSLRRLDPALPNIKSRKWRASKADWLLRNTDIATTAISLQNSEETVRASYAAGSPVTQAEEMSAFFEQLETAVLARGTVVDHGVEIAVGDCASYGNPHQVKSAPVQSDCKAPEGCLFCDKYKVHADEKDVRKLLSCRYCIQQTAHMVASEEHFQILFAPILTRIASLIEDIDQREPGLASRIEQEVERGELDPYWSSKLEMLIELELVG